MDFSRSALLTRFDVSLLHSGPMMEKNHYAPQQIDFCNLHFITIIIMQNANSAFYNSTYRHLTTSPLLYSLKSMRLKISPTFGIICMQSSTEENSNISSSKGRKDNSQKIFFSCFKTILHRNQKGNALECKKASN